MSKASAVRNGFTLLEVVVTLVLLAVAAALVVPIFRKANSPNDDLPGVVAGARELAVRRAESLVLQVDDRGAWRLTRVGDSSTLGSGALESATPSLRIRVTPLGACFNEGPSGAAAVDWDAIACTPARGGAAR